MPVEILRVYKNPPLLEHGEEIKEWMQGDISKRTKTRNQIKNTPNFEHDDVEGCVGILNAWGLRMHLNVVYGTCETRI